MGPDRLRHQEQPVIRIVTDPACDLPPSFLTQHNVGVVPGRIVFGEEVLLGYPDLSPDEFYTRLAASADLPTQRDSTADDFRRLYERVLADAPGASILSIHVSEGLASTINAARQAAASFPGADIRLIDTRHVSLSEGLIVWEAARLIRQGRPVGEIIARLLHMRENTPHFFVVDTLEYLAKGGRVSAVQQFVGDLLDVKPVLAIEGGQVETYTSFRTRARALDALRDLVVDQAAGLPDLRLGVMHARREEDAARLASDLRAALDPAYLLVSEIGPIVGTHAGPGAIGAAWYAPPVG